MDHCHNTQLPLIIPSAVLLASFLGSWHCVGMCGGLILASTRSTLSIFTYHLGRLAGYITIGSLAAWLGNQLLTSLQPQLTTLATIFIGSYLIWLGIKTFLNPTAAIHPTNKLTTLLTKPLTKLLSLPNSLTKSALIGLCSVGLPCGWLYAFIAGVSTTESPKTAILFMTLFWLGTLPALLISPLLIQKVLKPIRQTLPKLSATLLILAGILAIALKLLK